ncbi:MAG: methyltransferase domain-containing protein [Actinomycetota bacterium]|nr:methyltransferase domain-containing protein [Actinomycetota bacterium]
MGKVRDAVRQELVAGQLAAHVPPPGLAEADSVGVLDIGCGQGSQAIRLARSGYEVTGVDLSSELLGAARAAALAEAPAVQDRLRFERGNLLELGQEYRGRFDVVCCHGVVMYLPSFEEAVTAVVGAARPGGLVSVLTRNRAGLAMRAGLGGDWLAAGQVSMLATTATGSASTGCVPTSPGRCGWSWRRPGPSASSGTECGSSLITTG